MAIISFGKKNAKTTLAAFLLLLHLVGPEAIANSQLPSTAQSREQAAVLFDLASKIVRMSPTLSPVITIRDTVKQLHCQELGTLYRALSADASTAHGQSPIFAVHDELGQVRGPRSELFNAIENAMGAHENPMSVVISTQAPNDADLLSVLIDDALAGNDPRIVVSLYTADMELDPFSEEAIRQANPAFGDFLNAKEVIGQAEQAKRMPAQEPLYRNYTLNQRVEATSPFVTPSVWGANGDASSTGGGAIYCGLDLSETNDLTALVSVSQVGNSWNVESTFWLPEDGLEERSRKDRVPYDTWHSQGYVQTTPGRSIEYEYVAKYLANLFARADVRKVAFDRYNMRFLRPWLVKAGLPEAFIDDRFVEFGQGYFAMSPALRNLESLLLNARLRHGNHPVLTMCAANAVVKMDEAGNRKLDKKRSRGRIDGLVALAMACEVANANASAAAGDVFNPSWLKYWTTEPKRGNRYLLMYAPSEKNPSEHTTAWVLELREDRTYCAVEIVRDRLNMSERVDLLLALHRTHQPLRVGYEERGHEADEGHIRDRQARENYRFSVTALGGRLTSEERVKRLVPLFEAGRFVLPEKLPRPLKSGGTVDMTDIFVREEYTPFPLGAHTEMLDCASRILDLGADFPALVKYKIPHTFPSEW